MKELYESLIQAIIKKDEEVLNELISDEAEFHHFSEKPLSKDEYISDVLNEYFKYYDYEIKHVEGNFIILRVDAELYGSKRNWWIFCLDVETISENGKERIIKSQIIA